MVHITRRDSLTGETFMALRDYSGEEDFYSQGFDREGVVSIWVSLAKPGGNPETDTLQDLCGVGYYDPDNQEAVSSADAADVTSLLSQISYAPSFQSRAIALAQAAGIEKARRVVVQYDFAYDPSRVSRAISDDPIFLGVLPYHCD